MTKFFQNIALGSMLVASGFAFTGVAHADGDKNWAGPYVGAFVGGAHHTADWNELDDDWWDGTETARSFGIVGGAYAGYNFQFNKFVVGVEADGAIASNSTSDNLSDGVWDDNVVNDLNWIATVRARAGIALNKVLVFATGGVAIADFDSRLESDDYPGDLYHADGTQTGWVVGAGAEYKFSGNLGLKAEVLYHDFGSDTYSQNGDSDRVRISNTVIIGRIGLTYSF